MMDQLSLEIIVAAEKIIGTEFETQKRNKIGDYIEYILDYNKKVNLISRKSEDSVLATGLIESYSLYEMIKDSEGSFLDVGSGGGIPGIIVEIGDPVARHIKAVGDFDVGLLRLERGHFFFQ